ncbi:hypothetical protein Tco_1172416 [Tanacetum coccineum]
MQLRSGDEPNTCNSAELAEETEFADLLVNPEVDPIFYGEFLAAALHMNKIEQEANLLTNLLEDSGIQHVSAVTRANEGIEIWLYLKGVQTGELSNYSRGSVHVLSYEALQKMMEDPIVQNMVYRLAQDVANSCRTGATTNAIFSIFGPSPLLLCIRSGHLCCDLHLCCSASLWPSQMLFSGIDPDVGVVQHIDSQQASLEQVIGSPYTVDKPNLTASSAMAVTPTTSTLAGFVDVGILNM